MYNVLFIILFGLYYFCKRDKDTDRAKRRFILVMTLAFSVMSGIRHFATGIDTYDYYMSFEEIKTMSWGVIFMGIRDYFSGGFLVDPGYTLFVKTFQILFPSFYLFNFFVAFVVTSALGKLIYHGVDTLLGYVVGYSYYISLLYWNVPNNLTRQSLAIGIIIFAMFFLLKKKRILAMLLILLSFLIHRSAVIGLIPVAMLYFRNSKLFFLSSLVLTPLIFLVGQELVNFLVYASASERYLIYLDSETKARPIAYIVEMLIFYFMGFGLWKKKLLMNDIKRVSYVCFAFSVVFVSMLWVNSDLIRIGMYFSIFGVVYLPYCIENANVKRRLMAFLIVMSLLVGRSLMSPQPYHFFWEQVELSDRYRYYV